MGAHARICPVLSKSKRDCRSRNASPLARAWSASCRAKAVSLARSLSAAGPSAAARMRTASRPALRAPPTATVATGIPAGIPVATVAIGGARNAGLLAVRILGAAPGPEGQALRARLVTFAAGLAETARAKGVTLRDRDLGR